MATPLSVDRLLSALKDEGVKLVEHRSWKTHNRNSKGSWGGVNGVMIHHTAGVGSGMVDLCYNGTADLPGPLCHAVATKEGEVYLVGHGRANHAGSIAQNAHDAVVAESSSHPKPSTSEPVDGNRHYYGIEIVNKGDGKDPYPDAQYAQAVRWAAALCRAHGWNQHSVIGHKEGTRRKVDPSFDMGKFRSAVADQLKGQSDLPNPPSEEDDMPQRTLYGTDSYEQNIESGTWTVLNFNRRHDGSAWEDKDAEPSFLFGPCFYSATVAVRAAGLVKGQELQIRLAHYRAKDGGGWERSGGMPIHSPVHDGGRGHFVSGWNGYISASKRGRVRLEVLHNGSDPVTIDYARAESLYWPNK